jgi:hypothetical protein
MPACLLTHQSSYEEYKTCRKQIWPLLQAAALDFAAVLKAALGSLVFLSGASH